MFIPAGVTASSIGDLLDHFPTSIHGAYSLRRFNKYTGACCRVRRPDDDNEADVNFNDLGEISLDSLVDNHSGGSSATILGDFLYASGYSNPDAMPAANNAYIVSWKDQSGGGRDVTQATEGDQPTLAVSGVLQTENGRVAIDFDSDVLQHSDASSYAQPNTYLAVIQSDATTGTTWFLDGDGSGGGSVDRNVIGHSINYKRMWADDYTNLSGSATDTDQNLWFAVFNGASTLLHINGGSDVASGDPGDYAMSGLRIGAHYAFPSTNYADWDGRIQEIIYYITDQSGTRAGMEWDVNRYYSIF